MKKIKLNQIKKRISGKVAGTEQYPRLAVFKSGKHIYAQIIDDAAGKTKASASDVKISGKKTDNAKLVGQHIAEAAKSQKINKVRFDRAGFRYHGRVKALADAAREHGLEF